MNKFSEKLNSGERLFFDGGYGTLLQSRGLAAGELPERWSITKPEEIKAIHRAYAAAGADIIKTNTFGANRLKLGDELPEIVAAACKNARDCAGGERFVTLNLAPCGKLLSPMGDYPFESAVELFAEVVRLAIATGDCDLVLIETMSDTYEAKAAMLAVKENSALPFVVNFTLDESGRLLTGGGVLEALILAQSLGASAAGFNCGQGADGYLPVAEELENYREYINIPTIFCPNAGIPFEREGKTVFPTSPAEFAAQVARLAPHAQILGGCCGTTPEHIAAEIAACRGFAPPERRELSEKVVVSSFGRSVIIGGDIPVSIGERLNPTGKPELKNAYRSGDMGYVQRMALSQAAAGANILDVNAGLPDISEPSVLKAAVESIQSVCELPLQIDTSSPEAAEAALRAYNGRAIFNSVNAKPESLCDFLPIVKKYGAAVVALALDENGIPETSAGRVAAAQKIARAAHDCGLARGSVVADMLTLTISTGAENAKITLEAVENAGMPTVLGVSNISFGLPEREVITSAFLTLCFGAGLSAAIVNPESALIKHAFASFNALAGLDESCEKYISLFSEKPAAAADKAPAEVSASALKSAIESGLSDHAGMLARELLASGKLPPLEVIDGAVIPALTAVGALFEAKKLFLPSLLSSASAASAAAAEVKSALIKSGQTPDTSKKIVLATVKGDIHDIGKNIVKILLENYGFFVVDLGRDVSTERVLTAIDEHKPALCGLSALMTTTVANMRETIAALRERAPEVKIMVGGAVLTADYAAEIGADFYSADALGAVKIAQEVFGA